MLLLLKLLIFTSSVFKLLCGIICSQRDSQECQEKLETGSMFYIAMGKRLDFPGISWMLRPWLSSRDSS